MAKARVAIVGDASQLERTYKRAARSTQHFTREIERMGRGALSGSGAVRHLGRSLAFASGGFVAFEGVTTILRDSVDAAREAAVAQRSLAAQMKASGESFAVNQQRIEKLADSYAKFGFTSDDVIKSLTVLERGTGNINDAFRVQGLTADIARAKGIDLAAAANVVAKVFGGQETALRRAVPGLQKTAHGWDLIREAQRKMAGQAAANTTAAERFNAAMFDFEKIIGRVLLPILNRYLNRLSDWLSNSDNQEKVANRVRDAVHKIGAAFDFVSNAMTKAKDAVGGWTNLLAGVIGAWVGFKAAGVAAAAAVEFANIAAARGTAAAWRAALISTGWGALVVAASIAATEIVAHWSKVKVWFREFWIWMQEIADKAFLKIVEPFSHLPGGLGKWARDLKDQLKADIPELERQAARIAAAADKATPKPRKEPAGPAAAGAGKGRFVFPTTKKPGVSPVQKRIDELQLAVDQAGLTTTLADDLRALRRLEAYLKARIRVQKNNLDLRKQLVGVESQIIGILKQQADNAKQAREAARQRAAARAEARQFRALGFGPTGEDLIPGVGNLRRQLKAAREAIRGTFLDTSKERGLLGRVAEVLSGQLGKVGAAVRQKIAEILANIRQQLKDGLGGGEQTRFRHASVAALISGLGLSPAQAIALGNRLATLGPGGTVPRRRAAAFAGAGGIVISNSTLHFHGVQDLPGLERQLTKRRAARPHNRRGAH